MVGRGNINRREVLCNGKGFFFRLGFDLKMILNPDFYQGLLCEIITLFHVKLIFIGCKVSRFSD